jgi:sugar/nucleoside kinase (ribokinase family)
MHPTSPTDPLHPPKSAVVAGHICLDIIPGFETVPDGQFLSLLQPGKMITAGPATLATGGAVSNTGLSLFRLGIPTQLIAKIGNDSFADAVRRIVSSYDPGLTCGMVVDEQIGTSYTVILSPPGLDRMFLHYLGPNQTFSPADIDYHLIEQADLFHFGYPPVMREFYKNEGAGLVDMLRRAKAAGVTTSIDLTFPDPLSESGRLDWRPIFTAALPYTDVFAPSVEELLFLLRRPTFERLAARGDVLCQVTPDLLADVSDELRSLGAKIIMLKLGDCGAYLRTAGKTALAELGAARPDDLDSWSDREFLAPCFRVNVVGTTGSGDATIAGLLSALLRGLSAEQALTIAVAVGACNVEAADALSGVPTWPVLMQRLQNGWERLSTRIPTAPWQWQPDPGLWISPRDRSPAG